MTPRTLYLLTVGIALGVGLGACSGGATSSFLGGLPFAKHHTGSSPIQHIILVVQENRSFDNLFATFPGANGANYGCAKTSASQVRWAARQVHRASGSITCPSGDKVIKLAAHKLLMGYDLQHCHAAFETDYDGGNMDGFYLEGKGACLNATPAPSATAPYQYVEESQIKPYWDIAKAWVLADEMFQTQGSGSFTAHQDLIRGNTCIQACSSPSPPADSESLVDNPDYWPWGCDASKSTVTSIINIYGVEEPKKGPFPCSNDFPNYGSSPGYETLRDLLDAAGVSWKYYTPCFSSKPSVQPGCTPSNGCTHGEVKGNCDGSLLNAFDVIYPVRYGSEWGTNVSWPETNIFSDITNGALPAVSWVIPTDADNDHPSEKTDKGPEWVASVVNAIGQSSYWSSSVIIVLWDDWGGFYDNAVPEQFSDVNGGLGFRVPMMAISPYAIAGSGSKGGYISHTQYEFGSILKYIEQNWNLGTLGTTDARATSIANVFNYSQTPRSFTVIPTAENAQYFINQPHTVQHGDAQ
jgi:phospholipase C